jgi:transcriptional regulator with XRE-family HTH domain
MFRRIGGIMNYNEFTSNFADRLIKIREALNLTVTKMASELKVNRINYVKNENNKYLPRVYTLFMLGTRFNVSLNWLIMGIGSMFLLGDAETNALKSKQALLTGDNLELLEYMDKIPLLRHEILAQFQRFKEDHPVMVNKAFSPALKKEEESKK